MRKIINNKKLFHHIKGNFTAVTTRTMGGVYTKCLISIQICALVGQSKCHQNNLISRIPVWQIGRFGLGDTLT